MGDFVKVVTSDIVKVNVTNSMNDSVVLEKRFNKDLTISDLKSKLEIMTGGNGARMQLVGYNGDRLVCKMDNNDALLGSYPIDDGMRIHVITDLLFDPENVQKFTLTEEQYDQKEDSLKNFLKKNNLGKYNEEEMKQLEEKRLKAAEEEKQRAELCTVGSRCRVTIKGQPRRLGTVMYNGLLEGKRGIFIGIKYDEPLGRNDGSVDGTRYFECPPKYGSFVAPSTVEVGDFPPEDLGLDDEI